MKRIFYLTCSFLGILGVSLSSFAQFHGNLISMGAFDLSASVGRILSTAVKNFLTEDTNVLADLVWDDINSAKGGAGGCYGGAGTSAPIQALSATLMEISVDSDIYGQDGSVSKKNVGELAKKRMETIVKERSALDELKKDELMKAYRSQQRSIQAMADALVIKKAYKELDKVMDTLYQKPDYSGYSAAASEIASRRIILDQLLGLKKRVVAARVRVQAETLEGDSIDSGSLTMVPEI